MTRVKADSRGGARVNRFVIASLLVAAACFGAGRLGLALAVDHPTVSAVWPPTGIALVALWLGGYRMTPAVALGALLTGASTSSPLVAVLGGTLGATLEAVCAVALLRSVGFDPKLERVRDVVALVGLAGVLSTAVSATIGVGSLWLANALPAARILSAWRVWWLGDVGGVLIVASAALVLIHRSEHGASRSQWFEGIAVAALLTTFTAIVLRHDSPLAYLLLPALVLVALRFRQVGAVVGGVVLSIIAVWFTSRGWGLLAAGSPHDALVRAQTFVSVAAVTSLLVAAARSERRVAETALSRLADSELALAHQASHDPLTGLPNRVLFLDRLDHALARARRSRGKLAVLFLDLDDFKLVNDTRGHEAGDLLLIALTPRLAAALRPGDTVARFGGDEFVVLCEELEDDDGALAIAKRIADACARPVTIGDDEHVVTVSAGVVIVDAGAATPSNVLRDADAAMYRAKANGKGRVEVFDEGMRERLIERIAIESALRRALAQDELRLFYQPVIELESGRIVGVEALLRWQHPLRGLLEPADFIHVAESSGLIVPIGEWVIEQACRQAARWRDRGSGGEPIKVSVNLSPRQVARSNVAESVHRILLATGLDASLLELEITEHTLLEEGDASARALRDLHEVGVRLVLDDFGTGYSSLSYLKRHTIDALKIDRSFVDGLGRDTGDGAIVNAMLSMANALDVGVTAEGVETAAQLARLREHGCRFAQGYLFSRPAPAHELAVLLDSRRQAVATEPVPA
jgi:diguanylate cyclase